MIRFKIGKCPKCGCTRELMFSNNPLSGETICFNCIKENLNYENIEHANFFCRSFNIPFDPELWMELAKDNGDDVFHEYTSIMLEDKEYQPNLYYADSTADIWAKLNKEWARCRSFAEILSKLTGIRESYVLRGRLKWGEQYTFEELIKLDSIYSRTLKANNITNPMQKEAVKTLCKLHVEMDEAIRAKDAKAIKDFSNAWSTFAKQADLETMINETKTDEITTVAELFQYMEDHGFQPKYYDGAPKDEVDVAIKDIQEANRRLILESTGLQQTLNDMIEQRKNQIEKNYAEEVAQKVSINDLLNISTEEEDIATESDEDAINLDLEEEDKKE